MNWPKIFKELPHGFGSTYRQIDIEDDSLIAELGKGSRRSMFVNFIYLLLVTIGIATFSVNLIVFLIYDVVLFQDEISINRAGAFVPTSSCDREQVLFVFNTSDLWADTGVQISERDEIKISVSGAFQSSLSEIEYAARTNRKPKYPWIGNQVRREKHEADEKSDSIRALCPDAYIGAILYRIVPDGDPVIDVEGRYDSVRVLNPNHTFRKAGANGNLYFAVNDIYLTDPIIEQQAQENRNTIERKREMIREKEKGNKFVFDEENNRFAGIDPSTEIDYETRDWLRHTLSLPLLCPIGNSLCYAGPDFKRYFQNRRDFWYDDNLGQIAVMIEIQRYIPDAVQDYQIRNKWWYRIFENRAFRNLEAGNLPKFLCNVFFLWFFWAAAILTSLSVLYIVTGVLCAVLFVCIQPRRLLRYFHRKISAIIRKSRKG